MATPSSNWRGEWLQSFPENFSNWPLKLANSAWDQPINLSRQRLDQDQPGRELKE